MASDTFYPAVGGDDGYCLLLGALDSSGNVLYLGNKGGSSCGVWVRFSSVNIPQGSTITGAYVKFTCISSKSDEICNLNCYFNDVGDAVAPANTDEFNALALTSAIAWDALPAWINDTKYDSPSLISILQNIVDRGDFSSGNAIQIILKDNSGSANAYRMASSIEFSAGAEKAELHVTWSAGWQGKIAGLVNPAKIMGIVVANISKVNGV